MIDIALIYQRLIINSGLLAPIISAIELQITMSNAQHLFRWQKSNEIKSVDKFAEKKKFMSDTSSSRSFNSCLVSDKNQKSSKLWHRYVWLFRVKPYVDLN